MRQIFVDTSFFYAHAFAGDVHHQEAVDFLSQCQYAGALVTTNFIFDELITILRYDFGHHVAVQYGKHLRDSTLCTLMRLTPEDEETAWTIFCKYADEGFSFTDCTSFALMHSLQITEAATFDAHFEIAGFSRLPTVPLKRGKRK